MNRVFLLILLIVAAVLALNIPIKTYTIKMPSGNVEVSIGITDYLLHNINLLAFQDIQLTSYLLIPSYKALFEDLRDTINRKLQEGDKDLVYLYTKFRSRYPYYQLCISYTHSTYVCGTYVLNPDGLELYPSSGASNPTILLSKEVYTAILSSIKAGDYSFILKTLPKWYREKKILFYRTSIFELLQTLSE